MCKTNTLSKFMTIILTPCIMLCSALHLCSLLLSSPKFYCYYIHKYGSLKHHIKTRNVQFILLLWTHFSEILIANETFSFKKKHLKMSSGKWRPFCLGLNVLRHRQFIVWPWNFEVKVTTKFKENLLPNLLAIFMVIVAQTDSNYGINTCIDIYSFYFSL